nr:MAG TPA: hypothetical protein [Caudoviricetes sp.]
MLSLLLYQTVNKLILKVLLWKETRWLYLSLGIHS